MVQIFTLRERLAALPSTVRRRAETSTLRASVIADARAVAPEIPRDADAGHLERAARRLLRRAAQDEFAREGVTRVPLPPADASRAELRRADVPGEASFQAFVEDVLSAVDIAPSPLERDDAVELRDARGSSDAYGLSPEVASDLASYLLCRAHALDDGAEGLEEHLEAQARRIREEVRAALVRQVRVPLELTVARDRHERVVRGEADEGFASPAGGPGDAHATAEERADLGRRARSAFEFAQSEAGRAAFGALRSGAERAYERYGSTRTPPRTPPRT
ncbi:hypothetical protein CFK38_00930 [Brachybacterium vulturis]|uniref:Uncharacterized protein n=1 Tax=Brachybacterium vulturis TaxID=2017484 RepID=A0A291GJL3_9MICO|nr:hypothetical protein [Brachybacterium vulturis]ATG50242.1 hypothetical protein CFK38_00930 [Brachybacterium vulturis]